MCNKLLCLLTLVTLVFVIGGVVVAGTAEPNLVVFYRFDETSGTVANDYSGNGYNGTVGSSSGWDSTGFYGNGCLDFDGSFNVDVPNDVVAGLSDEVTVSVWVNSDNPGTYANALFWGADSSDNRVLGVELPGTSNLHLWFHAGYESSSYDTHTYWNIANVVTYRGQWNNFTFTKDVAAGEMKIYVNGVLLGTATGKTKTMANIVDFVIGSTCTGGWDLQGKMADFRLYDRVLCEEEIADLAGTSLVGWWKFEETSGGTAYDSSSYRHDGTLGANNYWDGGVVMTGDNYGASKVGFTSADANEIFETVDDEITITFWAKNDFDNDSGHNRIFSGKNSVGTGVLGAEWPTTGGALNFSAGSGDHVIYYGANDSNSYNFIDMEQWHHYALVKDASESYMNIYIDGYLAVHITERYSWEGGGVLDDSMAGIVNFELCGNSANWHQFAGTVRDFRIYDKALDVYEVEGIYRQYENEFNNVYYFDADNGNDNYAGTSPATAWQSLNKFNSITFEPLDKILFKAGCVWSGNMTLHGEGDSGEPIVIDAYGDVSDEDDKPRINAGGSGTPLTISEVENWEINNLQLTNLGETRASWRKAISIYADDCGKKNHIYLKDLYIHSVNGALEFGSGGIIMGINEGSGTLSHYNDIIVENCHFETVDDTAILGGAGMRTDQAGPRGTHIRIRYNYFEDIGGAAIVPIGSDGLIIEGNVVNGAMKRSASCAIWPWAADNTISQYNEVYNCDDRGDGEAYDCDYFCDGTIFQYNYSHDNPGGFMRICNGDPDAGDYNRNSIVRYNISVNDGGSEDALIELWKKLENCKVYNNILYIPAAKGTMNFVSSNKYGGGDGGTNYWYNNIWYAESGATGRFAVDDGSTNYWSNNCFYGSMKVGRVRWFFDYYWSYSTGTPSDAYKITSNPLFVSPGDHSTGSSLTGYQIQSGSPCIGAGLNVSNNGGLDYWGNKVPYGTTDIGAHERQ